MEINASAKICSKLKRHHSLLNSSRFAQTDAHRARAFEARQVENRTKLLNMSNVRIIADI